MILVKSLGKSYVFNINNFVRMFISSLSYVDIRVIVETAPDFIFWAPKSLQMVTAAMKLKDTCSLEGKL